MDVWKAFGSMTIYLNVKLHSIPRNIVPFKLEKYGILELFSKSTSIILDINL